jgi:hypothetical protein
MRASRVVPWALLLSCSLSDVARATGPGPSIVSVNGYQLMVQKRNPDGSLQPAAPYTVRGVDWSPASQETQGDPVHLRAEFGNWYLTDAPLLQAMNINTVRVYLDMGLDASALAILDELYARGIMAIVTVDSGVNDLARVQQVVSFYKDHPAILMWSLGNEWNVNLYYGSPGCGSPAAAAQCTQTAAQIVKSLDLNHPVASSYGDIDIDAPGLRLADTQNYVNNICTAIDLWTVNIFRGPTFGSLFDQWRSIASKPLLIGEFGTDAMYHPSDLVDEAMQAGWDLCLWNDLATQLSAAIPALVSPGGLVFEWNDEWWKVLPPGQHDPGGFPLIGGHPDDFANEEYFGLFAIDINRTPRQVVSVLGAAFGGSSRRPPRGLVFGAASRGTNAAQYDGQYGYARFYQCGKPFYDHLGGGGGGRGFNVVALDPSTGAVIRAAQNFDTWSTTQLCASNDPAAQLTALVNYLNDVPMGSLVLLSVADEAGLTLPNTCTQYSGACFSNGIAALEALGSTQIGSYCFRDSWAMIAVKGAGHAIAEGLSSSNVVSLLSGLPDPGSFGLTVNKAGQGTGTIQSSPAGIACGSGCPQQTATFATSTLVALTVTAAPGSLFTGWSGDPDCTDGVVTVDANKTCTANFALTTFLLSVSKQGTGSGSVMSAPAGISCGTTCSAAFSAGAVVGLSPSPDMGSVFVAWGGACSRSGACSVTMDAAKSVTATFARSALQFFTVAPCRVFDTRGGTPLASGSARTFQVSGVCGLPATARAVSTNVTVVGPSGAGNVVLFPGNANAPPTNTISFNAAQIRANNAIVGLAANGDGTVGALAVVAGNGTTDLVLDVNGYFE